MKKEFSLEEAREILNVNGDVKLNSSGDKFLVSQYENFDPPLTLELSKNFTMYNYDQYLSDFIFRSFPEYTDGMNMEFNGTPTVLFGKYKTNGDERVFEATDPKEAEQVLIQVDLDDDKSISAVGSTRNSPEAQSSKYFSEIYAESSFWHTIDYDEKDSDLNFYIVNVGHVLGQPDRDVSQYLQEMSERIAQEEVTYEQQRKEFKQAEFNACPYYFRRSNNDFSIPVAFTMDGELIEPDYYDQGNQISEWERFYVSDIVVSFTKESENAPFTFHPEWIPREISEAQEDAIKEFVYDHIDHDAKLVDENGRQIQPNDIIHIFEEKRNEMEMDWAFDEFKSIEEELEKLTAESLEIEVDKQDTAYHLGERYLELADQYGFETKFEIEMENEKDIDERKNELDLDK